MTVERRPDLEVIDASVSSPALLVRSETFDRRWNADVDGNPVKIIPADSAFQAVALPAGRHRVTFQYRDPLILWGMFVSLATLFGCAVALSRWRRVRRIFPNE